LELDAKTKTCLAEGELSSRLDEQARRHFSCRADDKQMNRTLSS
jgi:hypothetical protein